ncbi:helix-turn-helix domain-containing transcriptional regulator [Aeromonas caviae]|uniref:helix-turn-helix domain-containing transcriptional regulator n=1 Tax=Aeromonas caviae TaxID=648 RepID=UPI0038D2378C
MKEEFSRYEPSEYLMNELEITVYLNEAIETGDPELLAIVLGDIAKARSRIGLNIKPTS